jgi:hypothetical protein
VSRGSEGSEMVEEEIAMRLSAWLLALVLIVTLLALPRSLYACPS